MYKDYWHYTNTVPPMSVNSFKVYLNILRYSLVMTIIKEYLSYTEKHKAEYGEKTLVLMQVGSFFEAYGLLDKNDVIYGSNIEDFSRICDMVISRKRMCAGKARVVMAGFGLYVLEKYVKKLQATGYTTVVYTQDTQAKNTTRSLAYTFLREHFLQTIQKNFQIVPVVFG